MLWNVFGARRDTGEEVILRIEAPDEHEAAVRAARQGVLVESIETAQRPVPPEYMEPEPSSPFYVAPEPDEIVPFDPAAESPAAPPTVAYSTPGRAAPAYRGIVAGAAVLDVFGWLLILIGVLAVVATVVFVIRSQGSGSLTITIAEGAPAVVAGVLIVAAGLLVRLLASTALAVRDIARNSFRS